MAHAPEISEERRSGSSALSESERAVTKKGAREGGRSAHLRATERDGLEKVVPKSIHRSGEHPVQHHPVVVVATITMTSHPASGRALAAREGLL